MSLTQKPVVEFAAFESLDIRVGLIISANLTEGTRKPCREMILDVGTLGQRRSIGQFALVPDEELVGRKVLVCCNFVPRKMGKYLSEALVLGTPHPQSTTDQSQALPTYAHELSKIGDHVY